MAKQLLPALREFIDGEGSRAVRFQDRSPPRLKDTVCSADPLDVRRRTGNPGFFSKPRTGSELYSNTIAGAPTCPVPGRESLIFSAICL